jgi:hypothetical protein
VVAASLAIPQDPADASDTATRWDRLSESSACGEPFTRTPVASKRGGLSDSEAILGPFGTYFGRSVSEVRSKLVSWTVPGSGGMRVQVHQSMLPSLRRVTETLRAHARQGRIYEVTSAHAFTPRTIGGRYHVSRHAMGLAIDLNPARNPYRSDDVLITDMPAWFVDAWREAGFCWGGDWRGSKDPMHFSWMGPGVTPQDDIMTPIPPRTTKTAFEGPVDSHPTPFGPVSSRYTFNVADASSNGAPDVAGIRSHGPDAVIDIALGAAGYGECSIGRWHLPGLSVDPEQRLVMADVDGDSGQDLIVLSISGDSVEAWIATRRERFEDATTVKTGAAADSVAFAAADLDGDHLADLWEATADGKLRIWGGPTFTELLDDSELPGGAPKLLAAGDRDGGDTPELFALYPDGDRSRIAVLTYSGSWSQDDSIGVDGSIDAIAGIGAVDYDGDGRSDAQVFTSDGDLEVFIGNSSTGIPPARWFIYPERDCDDPVLLEFSGTFMDDEASIFESEIESIAAAGVTKGCNPPFNDRFCPEEPVTREQMAAFIVRALHLTDETHPGFTDVPPDSTFSNDIAKLAAAGITKGCNPPKNDEFCGRDQVTREQMAAFIVRAVHLTDDDHPGFTDVPPNSTFANDIARLAAAGITKGCNPPENDEFCPAEEITRGQMAAFLDRAGLGEG